MSPGSKYFRHYVAFVLREWNVWRKKTAGIHFEQCIQTINF